MGNSKVPVQVNTAHLPQIFIVCPKQTGQCLSCVGCKREDFLTGVLVKLPLLLRGYTGQLWHAKELRHRFHHVFGFGNQVSKIHDTNVFRAKYFVMKTNP